MSSFNNFHRKRIKHRFSSYAGNEIQDDDPEQAAVVIIGPPTGGQNNHWDNEGNEVSNTIGLPEEIVEEVEVLNIRTDKVEVMTSGGTDSNM